MASMLSRSGAAFSRLERGLPLAKATPKFSAQRRSINRMAASSTSNRSLAGKVRDLGLKHLLVSFDDLFGVSRSKLVPAAMAAEVEENGAGFAGFAAYFDMSPADADMLAFPDPESLVQLPWEPEIGWVASDLKVRGKTLAQGPRNVLKKIIGRVKEKHGLVLKTGVECEFFLVSADGKSIADSRDISPKPCYDQLALMRQKGFICDLNEAMWKMGFPPYQTDHEDANGQFECNWDFDDALVTSDRHTLFKFTVKSLAEKHGLRATFMPKPFNHLTGNGCHVHLSLHCAKSGANVFKASEVGSEALDHELLSDQGRHFVAGLLSHAPALCAITNPTVNSYKRLSAPVTASGATWAPASATWAGNNRSHMIRIPDAPRIELRIADMSTNAYLLPAAVFAAGMNGIEQTLDPGAPHSSNAYEGGSIDKDCIKKKLPRNLLDALRALEADGQMCDEIGEECTSALIKLRLEQWHDYKKFITDWERLHTLDC